MPSRINRAIELLAQDQAIYYDGPHSGHVLTHAQGTEDARTWADYINVGMEHGAFDMTGLAAYMRGLVDGGPTRSGHRTPAVIVEAPVNGTDAANVRFNAWQFRQILGRGVHGILLCQAESADAVRAFVESCRYPFQLAGVDPALPTPHDRLRGARRPDTARPLGTGTRGRGSEPTAAPVWGLAPDDYMQRCDPWPLNPQGELLLGVKLESPEGVANCEAILDVPGLGVFAARGEAIADPARRAVLDDFLGRLARYFDWYAANLDTVERVYIDKVKQSAARARYYVEFGKARLRPIDAELVRREQKIADALFEAGAISRKVDVTPEFNTTFNAAVN